MLEAIALVVSVLALAASARGVILADRRGKASERIAREALDDARGAREGVVWDAMIESAARFVALDPMSTDIGEPFASARVREIALADALGDPWNLWGWLALEHRRGGLSAQEAMERGSGARTVDERVEAIAPLSVWASAFQQNLRHLRRTGPDPVAVARLERAAREGIASLCERNGWVVPPEEVPGVSPL